MTFSTKPVIKHQETLSPVATELPHVSSSKEPEKVNKVAQDSEVFITPPSSPRSIPSTPTKGLFQASSDHLARLRYAQASMKDATSDGIPLETLKNRMLSDGYNPEHPIRTVVMSPTKGESPKKKLVAFDTRRTSAARAAARENDTFEAMLEMHDKHETAQKEYEGLKHLTFHNRKIPRHIRDQWITKWNEWHLPEVLEKWNLQVGTWGHLVKLRMAMSTDPVSQRLAKKHSGFQTSPVKRTTLKRRVHDDFSRKKSKPTFDLNDKKH